MNSERNGFGTYGSYCEVSFLDRQFGLMISEVCVEIIDRCFQFRGPMRM